MTNTSTEPRLHKELYECNETKINVIPNVLPPKKALERQEKEKKKKYCKPCENHPSWYQRTECSALKPEDFSKGLQSCFQKNGRSSIQQ